MFKHVDMVIIFLKRSFNFIANVLRVKGRHFAKFTTMQKLQNGCILVFSHKLGLFLCTVSIILHSSIFMLQGSHDREKSGKSREFCKGISRPGKSREKCVLIK